MEWWQSDIVYLKINDDILPVEPKTGYELNLGNYEYIATTEAGTTVRDLVRSGIPSISVNFYCDREMLLDMRRYNSELYVNVYFYSPYKILEHNLMYVKGYKEKLIADTPDGGIWEVAFGLADLENVEDADNV